MTHRDRRENPIGNEKCEMKKRHVVAWTSEEDNILRDQVSLHGTENWTVIASNFEDKTTRQCKRRWFTYLNSDFKKCGWSSEEDLILCEAQKVYGNRWTEIAKVVTGRTDNAVKNRFTTLCKKTAKENTNPIKRLNFHEGFPGSESPHKRTRLTLNARPPLPKNARNTKESSSNPEEIILHDRESNRIVEVKESQHSYNTNPEDGIKGSDLPGEDLTEFRSPLQVTPLFRSLTAEIPSPEFSESERQFLMKTIGMEHHPSPPCKRSLIHIL